MKSSYVPSSVLGTTIEPGEFVGTLTVDKGGTGLTAGTSGGIPAFTATGTIASSALLAANALMIGGGAGVAPSTTTTGAGVLVANINRPIFATVATAAGTTVLTVTSASTQEATGSTTQTYTLPVVTTLVAGWATLFVNKSTGNVTLNSSGGNAIVVLAGGQSVTLVCKSISSDTSAAAWDVVGRLQPLMLFANNQAVTLPEDATITDFTWTGTAGNMASALSGATFTAPVAGDYTFECLLIGEQNSGGAVGDGFLNITLTTGGNTILKTLALNAKCPYDGSNYVYASEYLGATLTLAAGDTIKLRGSYSENASNSDLPFPASGSQWKITQNL